MAVDLGQVALAEHQEMAAGLGLLAGQRLAEVVDEELAVRQAGDGVALDLALQRFDAGVLLLHGRGDLALGVDQGLVHARQFTGAAGRARGARRQRAYPFADIPGGPRFDPAQQVGGEQEPENTGGQRQADDPDPALPERLARQPGIGLDRDGTQAPAIRADIRPGRRGRFERQPGGAPVARGLGLSDSRIATLDLCVPVFSGNAHQGVHAGAEQVIGQLARVARAVGVVRQGPGQRAGTGLTLLGQLRIQIAVGGQHPQGLRAEQDEGNQESGTEDQPA